MTPQEIFTKVATHLLAQGQKAGKDRGPADLPLCYYRLGNLSCAVGCLIPEEEYSPCLEGKSLHGIVAIENFPPGHHPLSPATRALFLQNKDLLSSLQHVHDAYSPEEWKDQLQAKAIEYNFTMPQEFIPAPREIILA